MILELGTFQTIEEALSPLGPRRRRNEDASPYSPTARVRLEASVLVLWALSTQEPSTRLLENTHLAENEGVITNPLE